MLLLNAWILFGLIPLYFIYKKQSSKKISKRIRLLYISLFFMLLAASRPAINNAFVNQKFASQDFIIALDASYSMQANDLIPSRYIMAKKAIKKLLKSHPKDRFSLFLFTSNTLLISPPTTDTAITILALDSINPKYILTKSTSLKKLFQTITKVPLKQKKLIIFSDGGDEHDILKLTEIAKKNNIIPYIVATATQKGAPLKQANHFLKRPDNSLVISKINPTLKDLANSTNGKHYELSSLHVIDTLSNDLQNTTATQSQIKVHSYKELFYIPLGIAILLFFISITKLSNFFLLIPLILFMPKYANASLLDFYQIKKAKTFYTLKQYKKAAFTYQKVTPSVNSYYNIATSYYKAGAYKTAMRYYMQIKTKNPKIKQKVFYNMANCAFKLKKYDEAKRLYIDALVLGKDEDALYNLNLIKKLHLKTNENVAKMLPKKESSRQQKKQIGKKEKKKSTNKNASGSNRSSNKSTNGGGGNKKKKRPTITKKQKTKLHNYKIGYKAYEKINKGYSDEKEPW